MAYGLSVSLIIPTLYKVADAEIGRRSRAIMIVGPRPIDCTFLYKEPARNHRYQRIEAR